MRAITTELDYELVMVSNQDGLGSCIPTKDTFWPVHNFMVKNLRWNSFLYFSFDHLSPADNAYIKPEQACLQIILNNSRTTYLILM